MTLPISYTLDKTLNFFKTGTASQSTTPNREEISLEELLTYLAASTAHPGVVELATNEEVVAGASTVLASAPAGVAAAIAAEVADLNSRLVMMSFAGVADAGPCTATGLEVGDTILSVVGLTTVGDAAASFEATVTVDDQIQQSSASDLSLEEYMALVYKAA